MAKKKKRTGRKRRRRRPRTLSGAVRKGFRKTEKTVAKTIRRIKRRL